MLEQLRRNSRSFIIWILFGIIIAVFVISFGPQAKRGQQGCGSSSEYALEVADHTVALNSWRFAMNGLEGGGRADSAQRQQTALDLLVERELLAQEAEKRGFRVADDVVNDAIKAGDLYILGYRMRVGGQEFWRRFKELEGFANSMGLASVSALVEEQRRELLAEMTRALFLHSSAISDEEVRNFYIQDHTKVTADYVKFDSARYRGAIEVGEPEIARYAADHEADLKKAWESEKTQWTSDKPRVLARHIFVEAKDAAARTAARTKAEAARARAAGSGDFAAAAREVSDDALTRARGGLLGWRPADSLGYGKEVVEAVKKVGVGQVSDLIETPTGYHVFKVEQRADKGLSYDQKKLDLAARLAADHYARELARRDAQAALAQARTQPLDKLFVRRSEPTEHLPGGGEMDMDKLPPEIREQLEQLQQHPEGAPPAPTEAPGPAPEPGAPTPPPAPAGDKHGALWRESDNILAQAGGTAAPAAARQPASEAAPAPSASGEVLPKLTAPVEPPALETIGPVSRSKDFLAGIGKSEELVTDLFENLQVGKVADKVYEVTGQSDGFVIVQLKEREEADMTKFDKDRDDLRAELAYEKGATRLASWLVDRCEAAAKAGQVRVNRSLLETKDKDKRLDYQPCASLNIQSIAMQLRSREAP